jgi:hypothetical protein
MVTKIEAKNPDQGEPSGEPICMGCLDKVYYSMISILAMYRGIIIDCTTIPDEHMQALFEMSDNVIEDLEKIIDEE